jgi:superfamily I DNA/RNA helicase
MIVITFTNAAADEMTKRLPGIKFGWIGTLHGFLMRLLMAQHQLVGLPAKLSVIDDDQQEQLVETIVTELKLEKKVKAKGVMEQLKRWDLRGPNTGLVLGAQGLTREELVASEYHRRMRQSGLLDFDAILFYGEKLILALDGWHYTHLFVDEFQDSADADARVYEAMPCANKFIVGDPDQSIYSFRGGNVSNILRLAKPHPMLASEWQTLLLETNYRCAQQIATAAQLLIEMNSNRYPKATRAIRIGGQIKAVECTNQGAELSIVLQDIQSRGQFNDTAVLCRTNKQAGEFADHLQANGLPVASKKYQQTPKDWRAAKLLLTVMTNPWNDLAVHQFLTASRGRPAADKAKQEAALAMRPLHEHAMSQAITNQGLTGEFMIGQMVSFEISSESRERIVDACRRLPEGWTIPDLLFLLNSGEQHKEEIGQGVTVTTFHSAKGREFKHVHIVGAEQGSIPSDRKGSDLEEDRRVMYVAMTRARDSLTISWCRQRPVPFAPLALRDYCRSQFVTEAGL